MDFVNKLGGSELNTSNGTNSGTQQGNAGKEDYLDKGEFSLRRLKLYCSRLTGSLV